MLVSLQNNQGMQYTYGSYIHLFSPLLGLAHYERLPVPFKAFGDEIYDEQETIYGELTKPS